MRGPGHGSLLPLLFGSLWLVFMLLAATALFFLIRFAVLSALKGHTVWLENRQRLAAAPHVAPAAAAPVPPAAPPVPPQPDGTPPPAAG